MFRVRFPLVLRVTPRRRTVSSSGERYDTLLIIQQYKNESVSLDKYIYIHIYICTTMARALKCARLKASTRTERANGRVCGSMADVD